MRPLLLVFLVLAACGGTTPAATPAQATAASAEPAPAESAAPAAAPSKSTSVPMSCAKANDTVCIPDGLFVKRLCDGSFPDVALLLMSKDAPFTRMYLKGDIDGWNAEGGASASARARLVFDEEVLVLRRRAAPANGIVVGAGGGYLVMRWDGNCYTVEEGEVTAKKPSSPKHAPIPWRFYSDRTKNALLESPKILAAYQRRGKECKGAMSGDVSKGCEAADNALSAAVVTEVRGGKNVPTPEKLP